MKYIIKTNFILLIIALYLLPLYGYAEQRRQQQFQNKPARGQQINQQQRLNMQPNVYRQNGQQMQVHPNAQQRRFNQPRNNQQVIEQGQQNWNQQRRNYQNVNKQNWNKGNRNWQRNVNQNNYPNQQYYRSNNIFYPFAEVYTVFTPYVATYYDSTAASDNSYYNYYPVSQPTNTNTTSTTYTTNSNYDDSQSETTYAPDNTTYTSTPTTTNTSTYFTSTPNYTQTNSARSIPNGTWVAMSNGHIANNAIPFQDADGNQGYYCRAVYRGQVLYGMLVVNDGCYIVDQTATLRFDDYDVLTY